MSKCNRSKLEDRVVVDLCMNCVDDLDEWVKCNIDSLGKAFAFVAWQKMRKGGEFPSVAEFETFCRKAHAHCLSEFRDMTATRH